MKTLLKKKNFWKNVDRHYLSQHLALAVKWPWYLFTFCHPYVYANLFHPFPHTSSSSIFWQKYFKHSGLTSRISCTNEPNVKDPVSCTAIAVGVDALSPLEGPEGKYVTDFWIRKNILILLKGWKHSSVYMPSFFHFIYFLPQKCPNFLDGRQFGQRRLTCVFVSSWFDDGCKMMVVLHVHVLTTHHCFSNELKVPFAHKTNMEWLFICFKWFALSTTGVVQKWLSASKNNRSYMYHSVQRKESIWFKLWETPARIMQHKLNENRNLGLTTSGNNPSGLI